MKKRRFYEWLIVLIVGIFLFYFIMSYIVVDLDSEKMTGEYSGSKGFLSFEAFSDKISFGSKKPGLGKAKKGKLNIEYKQIPLIVAAIIIVIGIIFYQEPGIMGNLIVLGAIVGIAPYALFSYFEYSKIRAIEDQLPIFLLDLAESQKEKPYSRSTRIPACHV